MIFQIVYLYEQTTMVWKIGIEQSLVWYSPLHPGRLYTDMEVLISVLCMGLIKLLNNIPVG